MWEGGKGKIWINIWDCLLGYQESFMITGIITTATIWAFGSGGYVTQGKGWSVKLNSWLKRVRTSEIMESACHSSFITTFLTQIVNQILQQYRGCFSHASTRLPSDHITQCIPSSGTHLCTAHSVGIYGISCFSSLYCCCLWLVYMGRKNK